MKNIVIVLLALVMVFGVSALAHAALIDRGADSLGNHLIYDTDLNITWYDYTNAMNTWQNQLNWANALTVDFNGTTYDAWRLPSTVDGLQVSGYDGSTTIGFNITTSEMGHLFYAELGNKGQWDTAGVYVGDGAWGLLNTGPFVNLQSVLFTAYWSATEYAADPQYYFNGSPTGAWLFEFYTGNQQVTAKDRSFFALAVFDGDIANLPEPGTALFLGMGLVGLIAGRRMLDQRQG